MRPPAPVPAAHFWNCYGYSSSLGHLFFSLVAGCHLPFFVLSCTLSLLLPSFRSSSLFFLLVLPLSWCLFSPPLPYPILSYYCLFFFSLFLLPLLSSSLSIVHCLAPFFILPPFFVLPFSTLFFSCFSSFFFHQLSDDCLSLLFLFFFVSPVSSRLYLLHLFSPLLVLPVSLTTITLP